MIGDEDLSLSWGEDDDGVDDTELSPSIKSMGFEKSPVRADSHKQSPINSVNSKENKHKDLLESGIDSSRSSSCTSSLRCRDGDLKKVIDLMACKQSDDDIQPQFKTQYSKQATEQKINDYRQLLSTFTTLFGSQHERTNEIKHILATLLFKNSQFEESWQLFEDLKVAYAEEFGEKSVEAIKVSEKCLLSQILSGNVIRIAEAVEEFCQEQKIDGQTTDPWKSRQTFVDYLMKHEYYGEAQRIMEDFLSEQGVVDEIEESLETLLKVKMKLADCYKILQKYQNSLDLYCEILSITRHGELFLNENELLAMKENIADLYCKVEDFENALGTYFDLYSSYIEHHDGECPETLSIRTSIAETLLRQDKIEDALKIYRAVFDSYLNLPETSGELKIHMKHIIGHVYLKENRLFEALETFRDVLHEYEDLYQEDTQHADVLEARSSVAAALLKEKKFAEAKVLYKQVWESYKSIHGEEHEKTIRIENILIDLEKLDSMFTSEDREKIDKNVRENEDNHFGSQDFVKYILPKLTVETSKVKKEHGENEVFLVSNMEESQNNDNESQSDGVIDDILSDSELNLRESGTKDLKSESDNNNEEGNDLVPGKGRINSKKKVSNEPQTDFENPFASSFDPWMPQPANQNSHPMKSENTNTNPVSWDDISLGRNEEADETTDIMQEIEEQNQAKKGSKKKKKKGSCCVVS